MVTPDRIYLNIFISEKDTKDKISLEELENRMETVLKSLKIDTKNDLVLQDLASNFKTYFLKQKDVLKSKLYQLKITDAQTAGRVIVGLENAGISNVQLDRTEYAAMEKLQVILKSRAVLKAKAYAVALTQPLGQKVGSAIYISEQNQQSYDGLYGKAAGISIRGMSTVAENFEPIDIEFQKIKVLTSAGVKFKLLD
ncbi:MAG: SIMPL domain-containing protein [Bacteroidetes bacterium HGW-Bacteroidetes-13]|nr:MAG: SIMPL domain-containing protein [Bacteroidetes bacterium HGW-Bacteroidetes-13]